MILLNYNNALFENVCEKIKAETLIIFVISSFQYWVGCDSTGRGDCMGYSTEDHFYWNSFACSDYIASDLLVGFLCQGPLENTGKIMRKKRSKNTGIQNVYRTDRNNNNITMFYSTTDFLPFTPTDL